MALHLLERHMAHVFGVDVARLRERSGDRYATRYVGTPLAVVETGTGAETTTHERPDTASSDAIEACSEAIRPS